MPRARSPNRDKAYELWIKSDRTRGAIKKIAAELGVSEELVRKWKNQDGWDSKEGMVTLPIKEEMKSNVTNHKGGQPGNSNAAGHRPSTPKRNRNAVKHGAYCQVFADVLSPKEMEIMQTMDVQTVESIKNEIKLLTVRELRLMKRIWDLQESTSSVTLDSVIKRKLEIKGSIVSGTKQEQTETTTKTISTPEAIRMYESELTKVQRVKGAYIKTLYVIVGDDSEQARQDTVSFIEALNQTLQPSLEVNSSELESEDGDGAV